MATEIELTTRQYDQIDKAIDQLNKALKSVKKSNPAHDIQWYLSTSGLHLMDGPPQNKAGNPLWGNAIETFYIDDIDNGDW